MTKLANKQKQDAIGIVKHYMRRTVKHQSKELIAEVVTNKSATAEFLRRVEARRLVKECFQAIDLRGKVAGKCQKYQYRNRSMWMDKEAYKDFTDGLKANNGLFTIGVFEKIQKRAKAIEKQLPRHAVTNSMNTNHQTADTITKEDFFRKWLKTAEQPDILQLGYYRKRNEERLEYKMDVVLNIGGAQYDMQTRDISVNGLCVSTREIIAFEDVKNVEVTLTELAGKEGTDLSKVGYRVVNVIHVNEGVHLHIVRADANTELDQVLREFIQNKKQKCKLNIEDELLTTISSLYEKLYTLSTAIVPFFIVQEKEVPRIVALGESQSNTGVLETFRMEDDEYDLNPFTHPGRVAHLLKIADSGTQVEPLLAVYKEKQTKQLISVADFEFPSKKYWLEYVGLNRDRPDFRVLKVIVTPMSPPECMKIVDYVGELGDYSLEKAEELVAMAQGVRAVAALVDITQASKRWVVPAEDEDEQSEIEESNTDLLTADDALQLPQVIRFGYTEQRKEERWLVGVTSNIKIGKNTYETTTRDISIKGLCLKLDANIEGAHIGETVYVNLPTLAKRASRSDIRNIPYTITGITTGREKLLHLGRVMPDDSDEAIGGFFQDLIERNKDKLELDLQDMVFASTARIFEAMTAGSTATMPLYICRDAQGVSRLSKIAVPYDGIISEFFEIEDGDYDFSPLAVPSRVTRLYNEAKKKGSASLSVYMFKRPLPGGNSFELLSASENEFSGTDEKKAFISEALKHDHCFVNVLANKASQPAPAEIDKVIDPLRVQSRRRANQVSTEIEKIAVVGDVINMTREVAECYLDHCE